MLSHTKESDCPEIPRLSRKELLRRLLESNKNATFQFTRAWLNKQWTQRLRSLLLATEQQLLPQE